MKYLKYFLAAIATFAMAFTLAACGTDADNGNDNGEGGNEMQAPGNGENNGNGQNVSNENSGKILVVYFSCTNITEGIAKKIQTATGSAIFEIVPEIPYTSADLNYNNDDSRANKEQNNPNARPAINGRVENIENYETVFIGYPIWWGQAPKIIYTFLESYDFSGKTLIPFCTSGSSGIGSSATNLHSLTPNATWLDGQRFSGSASQSTVTAWVNGLNY